MPDYKIIADSSSDLGDVEASVYDIEVLPLYVSFDSEIYLKDRLELSPDDFYIRLKSGVFPKTSLPNIQDFLDSFTKYLDDGKDIIYFSITSKFSGSYQSAINAKNILLENYPDRKIEIIDSMQVTYPMAVLIQESGRMRKDGISFEENIRISNKIKVDTSALVTVDTLEYLQKGGRIGKVSSLAGTLLNIKPIIYLRDGELQPYTKVRGRKKALNEMAQLADRDMNGRYDDFIVTFAHGDALSECESLKEAFAEKYKYTDLRGPYLVGPIVGTHIGATTMIIASNPKYELYL